MGNETGDIAIVEVGETPGQILLPARAAVRACMAALVADAPDLGQPVVSFDGHVDDPHLFEVLQEIPSVGGDRTDAVKPARRPPPSLRVGR